METLESLEKRIRTAEDLLSVVKTMRTMAAADIRHYERAVASLSAYERTVSQALQVVMRERPPGDTIQIPDPELVHGERLGAVVFGSDTGLCGQFNERMAEHALNRLNGMHVRHQDRTLLTVGNRITHRLQLAHQPIEAAYAMPTSVKAIGGAVQSLLLHLDDWQRQRAIRWVLLFYNRKEHETSYAPHMEQLLPLDVKWLEGLRTASWRSRRLPVLFADWELLLAAFVRQTMLVALHRAFAESLASENASRLAAMQAAERSIGDHLEEFHQVYQLQRQQAITTELLDIVSGAEAVAEH